MKSYQVAAFGAPLVEARTPTPTPRGSEVLLEVIAAGVCHSDLHIWEGGYDLGGGKRLSLKDRGIALPLTMGHETAGRVIATGRTPAASSIGKTYLVYPWIGCGQCAICRRGDEQLCATPNFLGIFRNGGYADQLIAPHPRYLIDLEGLDPVAMAPFACSGLTAFSALNKVADIARDAPIAIIGAGGLGLIAIEILKAIGGKGAVSVDIDPVKREAAKKTGALGRHRPARRRRAGAIDRGARRPGARGDRLRRQRRDRGARLQRARQGRQAGDRRPLRRRGAVVAAADPDAGGLDLGSYVGSLAELRALVDLVRAGKVAPLPVTRCALHDADRALNDLRAGRFVGRAVLTPECTPA